jgi:hypothetical protein
MATVNNPGRIVWAGMALASGIGLWMATGLLHGADQTPEDDATTTVPPMHSASVTSQASNRTAEAHDSGSHPLSMAPQRLGDESEYWLMRQRVETSLNEQGARARSSLVRQQLARLRLLADEAERAANPERARLMRARVAYLEDTQAQLEDAGEAAR